MTGTDEMTWVRIDGPERPCRRCKTTTTRVEGYTDDGDCESGPFVVETPLCEPCSVAETAELDAMAEAYEAWERAQFDSDAEYRQYLEAMERHDAEMGDES